MIRGMCLLAISGFVGTMIGLFFYKRAKDKVAYYSEFIGYCDFLIGDICFRQQTVIDLTQQYLIKVKSSFSTTLNEFLNYLNGGELKLSKIGRGGEALIRDFFTSIGFSDAENQIKEIENFKNKFNVSLEQATKTLNTFGKNFIKLGFLFGLIFGLLLI